MQIGRGGVRAATFLVVGSFFLLSLDLKFSESRGRQLDSIGS